MSTALLKFQRNKEAYAAEASVPSLDASVLRAALEEVPEPIAICEGAAVLYANHRFKEICGATALPEEAGSPQRWRKLDFRVDGRRLNLRIPADESGLDIPGFLKLALVGRMVAGVAHDFNNLLTGILLYCDLLQTRVTRSNPLGKKIDEIRAAAEQGAGLIRQLMSLGREDEHAVRRVYLNQAISDLLPLLKHLVGEHIRVATLFDREATLAGISLAEAQQVVLNLVLNARDAMPGGGSVVITTRSRQVEGTGPVRQVIELTITDSGTGMDPKTASRIFEPFFTTKPHGQGTGMGLATVRKIVDEAGGMITVDTAPGKGTCMMVRLPQIELTDAEPSAVADSSIARVNL